MIGNQGRPGDPGEESEDFNKWGEHPDIDTADATAGQIIWPIKSTVQQYLFLDAPIALTLQSDSPNDVALGGGSGARTVKVIYHDDNGEIQEVILTMTGVTPVDIPSDSFGVFRMEVETSGSNNTNVGQLTIKNGTDIYATIEIGEGQTQIAVLRCPDNKQGLVKRHEVGYGRTGGNNEANMRLRLRKTDGTIVTKWDPIVSVDHTKDIRDYGIGGIKFLPGEFVYWECIQVSADNTPIRGAFDIRFEKLVS